MAKRHFLQLAHDLDLVKHPIAGAFMSEKLDGQRAFWDGGVSRGHAIDAVPWANLNRKGHLLQRPVSTGLWSRYGNVIHAPDWWLNQLPPYLLDGELTAGRGTFQYTMSVVKDHEAGDGWHDVRFMVLDSPRPDLVWSDGQINETNFKRKLVGCEVWARGQESGVFDTIPYSRYYSFRQIYGWLNMNLQQNDVVCLLEQKILPHVTQYAEDRLQERMDEVITGGGEGLVIRKPDSYWRPERSWDVLKYKPFQDAEGTVTGYVSGRSTALGSKLLGLMGALVLNYNGKRLELSGFRDDERVMCYANASGGYEYAETWCSEHPGQEVDPAFHNPRFPIGSTVTFRYRELSVDSIPKEARFLRVRGDN